MKSKAKHRATDYWPKLRPSRVEPSLRWSSWLTRDCVRWFWPWDTFSRSGTCAWTTSPSNQQMSRDVGVQRLESAESVYMSAWAWTYFLGNGGLKLIITQYITQTKPCQRADEQWLIHLHWTSDRWTTNLTNKQMCELILLEQTSHFAVCHRISP